MYIINIILCIHIRILNMFIFLFKDIKMSELLQNVQPNLYMYVQINVYCGLLIFSRLKTTAERHHNENFIVITLFVFY